MEKGLAEFSSMYQTGIAILAGIFTLVWLVRLYLVWQSRSTRHWIWKYKGEWFVYTIKFIFGMSMACLLLVLPTWFYIISGFRIFISDAVIHWFVLVWTCIAVQELILSFTASERLVKQFIKRILLFMLSIFWFLGFGSAALINLKTFDYPKQEGCLELESPVRGNWRASHAGGHSSVNYHMLLKGQEFGADLVKIDESNRFFKGIGTAITDFYSYRQPVYSPVKGKVVYLFDELKNQQVMHSKDSIHTLGNYLVIEKEPQVYVILGTLEIGSFKVSVGDEVEPGTELAQVGNSGNATWPHLHLSVSTNLNPMDSTAKGLPWVLNEVKLNRWGQEKLLNKTSLIRNDRFSHGN
ncbi:hypothetical protein MASR2M44_11820 [Bacteroidota bacterium]